nr:uncharacterized protein LOC104087531 [Nicotiana tomentosiformis]
MAEDSKLWDVICDGPFLPMKTIGETTVTVPKTRKEYIDADRKAIEKNFGTKKILVYGEIIPRNKLVKKILSVLPGSWESKFNVITEAKDLQKLTIDELVGNLKTYEMKKKKDHERREPKKEKNLILKADNSYSSGDDADMAYLTRRFQKMVRRIGDIPKKGSSCRNTKGCDCCHKCGKPRHFIKDFPLHKKDHYKHNTYKTAKRNPVPDRKFKRRDAADNLVKQALTAWGDFSSESEGEIEHGRDDLPVVVVDLKETIEDLKKEKDVLTEKIGEIEHERDDLLVVVMDMKETVQELRKDNNSIKTSMENCMNSSKGKEVASEAHLKLENELKKEKLSLCAELERSRQLQEDLSRVKNDLDKSLKWTCFSDTITSMYKSDGGTCKKLGSKKKRLPTTHIASMLLCLITGFAPSVVTLAISKIFPKQDFESLNSGDLTCLSVIDDDAELWHKRLGHGSFSLLNNLIKKDLVRRLPKSKFKDHKVCDACVKGKQVRSSFKPKKEVSTSRPLDLLHMDLCGPMRMPSRGGKKTKDEIFPIFAAFVKQIQLSEHPQYNGVVERKNRTLEDMSRTMLIDSGVPKSFWAEVVNTACYLINKCMIRSLLNKTPWELLNRRKPKLTYLRAFG